ncbi:helix-turn-helix domain-containing protein [Novosphingobium resinovorum]|uniref:winged helix-turn-helix transcriptional regulator n=1 Tax=Novosphingobium resinovorum TaxID=158500 RepID=UPI002ED0B962|nr:helix-turn-helix domain-containing protein [Novosphingobium resinovorum]
MTAEPADDPRARAAIAELAADMAAHGTARDAPVRAVMGLLGDRWSTLVLLVLATGACRHASLRRVLSELSSEGDVSQRVLTLKLRTLERDGFVERTASADVPPRVSYALTDLGRDLAGRARLMIDWVNAHEAAIHAARMNFDAAAGD